ncbi:hypothetical protein ABEB36_003336 [Hypothenemus hampei]|uniref:Uncharacterized protein n=1 Tax=Hypothenemus hampei TaxID=57062 RepID=A0ABD1F8U2_HYPHA
MDPLWHLAFLIDNHKLEFLIRHRFLRIILFTSFRSPELKIPVNSLRCSSQLDHARKAREIGIFATMASLQWEKLSPQEFQQLQDLAECELHIFFIN